MAESRRLLISCEHGGNLVPKRFREQFIGQTALLASHRGYDPGALPLARYLANALGAPLVETQTSRLLIDMNRSLHHRALFSAAIKQLAKEDRTDLIEQFWRPYRASVMEKIELALAHGAQVLHLAIHSFTPELDGKIRDLDVGLLFDPARNAEKLFCQYWRGQLKQHLPGLRIRFNAPYRGITDGLVSALRQQFDPQDYLGIELELNQALLGRRKSFPSTLQHALVGSLRELSPPD